MIHLAPIAVHEDATALSRIAAGFKRLRQSFICTNTGMERRARLSALPTDATEDTGFDPGDLSGVASFDPDLPFFLQSGFGRRDS